MIVTKELKTLEDFQALKKGDVLACEFHRNVFPDMKKGVTFAVFSIYANLDKHGEIVLQKKGNIYFNYKMFLDTKENSNLKNAILIYQQL